MKKSEKEFFVEIRNKYYENKLDFKEWMLKDVENGTQKLFGSDNPTPPNRYTAACSGGHGQLSYFVDVLCGDINFFYKKNKKTKDYEMKRQIYVACETLVDNYITFIEASYEFIEENDFMREDIFTKEEYQQINGEEKLSKRANIDYVGEDKLEMFDVSFSNDIGIHYKTTSFLFNQVGSRKALLNMSCNEKLTWLYVLESLSDRDIEEIMWTTEKLVHASGDNNVDLVEDDLVDLYFEGLDYDNEIDYAIEVTKHIINDGGREVLKKVFKHPLYSTPYSLNATGVSTFATRLQKDRENVYKKQYAQAKKLIGGNHWQYISNAPYVCGYDFSIALLAYKISHRFMNLKATYPQNHTQSGMCQFMGFKSHAQLKDMVQKMQSKLATEDFSPYEERYKENITESYQLYSDSYLEMQNLIQGNLEDALQNTGARNLHGVIMFIEALEKNSFTDKVEKPEEQRVVIEFNKNDFVS